MNIVPTKCKKVDSLFVMTEHHRQVGHIKYVQYNVEHVCHISFDADVIIMAHVLLAGIIKLSNSVRTRLTTGSCGKSWIMFDLGKKVIYNLRAICIFFMKNELLLHCKLFDFEMYGRYAMTENDKHQTNVINTCACACVTRGVLVFRIHLTDWICLQTCFNACVCTNNKPFDLHCASVTSHVVLEY